MDTHQVDPWRVYLSPAEKLALLESQCSLLVSPRQKSGMRAWGEKKIIQLSSKVPEGVKNQLTLAVTAALDKMRAGSVWLVSREKVYQKLSLQLGPIRGSSDLLSAPLAVLDEVAGDYARYAKNNLTFEGAAAGATGFFGLAADIPILYSVLFKTIQEIALCYGFPVTPPQERFHILEVLELGHNLGSPQRGLIALPIWHMQDMIRAGTTVAALEAFQAERESGPGAQTQALLRNFRLARQLAFDLLERKLLQSLVIVGSAAGAAANYQLARDVGLAAFHLYRRRYLMEVALRRATSSRAAPRY